MLSLSARFDVLAACCEAPNEFGPEAKPLVVQGAEPPESPRFKPHLRTKISSLRLHFYFSDLFCFILFCFFNYYSLFFVLFCFVFCRP